MEEKDKLGRKKNIPVYKIPKGSKDHVIKGNFTTKMYIKKNRKYLEENNITPKLFSELISFYYSLLRQELSQGKFVNIKYVGRLSVCSRIKKEEGLIPIMEKKYRLKFQRQAQLKPNRHRFRPNNRFLHEIYKVAKEYDKTKYSSNPSLKFECMPCRKFDPTKANPIV